jgi:hypothetical protein
MYFKLAFDPENIHLLGVCRERVRDTPFKKWGSLLVNFLRRVPLYKTLSRKRVVLKIIEQLIS